MPRQLLKVKPSLDSEKVFDNPKVTYGLATTRDELEQAFELVWQGYIKVGLHPDDKAGKRVTKYHLDPRSKVFIASVKEEKEVDGKLRTVSRVIGTLTVAHDGCLGLPADEVCKAEIDELRQNNPNQVEIMGFVCNNDGEDKRVFLKLFHLAYEYCELANITGVVVSLTQRHIGFYRRFFGFKPLGKLSEYTMGNGTPVQVHHVSVKEGRALFNKRTSTLCEDDEWCYFLETKAMCLLQNSLKTKPWSKDRINHFMTSCSSLQSQIDIDAANSLKAEYRRYGVELALPCLHLDNNVNNMMQV
ncbi:N-acyl amino acid synthase FeeM domain-containing protein [Neptunomonas qingdaonensis]|uniref:N-acyl amino acid synthase FeeM catalytic core domain-containing protein n=1 Tax=Neptunomonas qingdaonensis TaxID=1045558 RepID=A0A1I2MVJ6_9GAMM|nr:hypothetical protein [Neptunomonas qingdaonensis]SFF94679.1 hypothetical protein SAMN05216175_10277 [Neptunomonas qingdaonensis]